MGRVVGDLLAFFNGFSISGPHFFYIGEVIQNSMILRGCSRDFNKYTDILKNI
jgi:TM2 domain-containing membrane protein YozV